MANKVIKDGIWKSDKLANCSVVAQLHYPRLYLLTDDWSCFEFDVAVIKGLVYPKIKISPSTIKNIILELSKNGLIFIWPKSNPKFGYFTGDEEGRLPAPTRRHKRHTLKPPEEELAVYLQNYKVPTKCLQDPTKVTPIPIPNLNPNLNPLRDIVEIINYLNEIAKRNFSHKTEPTQKLISARLNEGYSIDDFKKVVRVKVAEWGNDEEMHKYLRPDTLFCVKHFDNYLNQQEAAPKEIIDCRGVEDFIMVEKEVTINGRKFMKNVRQEIPEAQSGKN